MTVDKKQREAELIDRMARFIIDNRLETWIKPLLQSIRPMGVIGGAMAYMSLYPYLEFIGGPAHDLGNILIDNPGENIDLLLKRIDELERDQAGC